MFPYIPTQTIKKLLWKTFHMFLSAWISDNRHICNCYLLIFNWLYRISVKNASIEDSCMSTPSKYTTKPIKTTISTSVRSTHVLYFSKPICLWTLQACKFVISCLIDHLPKQRNCEWFYSVQLCSQRHFVTLHCVTNSVTP